MTPFTTSDLADFIRLYGDKRISSPSFAFWESANLNNSSIHCFPFFDRTGLIAFTGCWITPHGEVKHSITIVHPAYRRLGVGAGLLKLKAASCAVTGARLTTQVALDNIASVSMCRCAGGSAGGIFIGTRKDGSEEFAATIYHIPAPSEKA